MDDETRNRSIHFLYWQRNYFKHEKGESNCSLLQEFSGVDPDFKKAFDLVDKTTGKLLDIGCGWGDLSRQAADAGYTVTAIDLSEIAIKRALQKHGAFNDSCRFLQMDFFNHQLEGKFEIITDRGFLAVLENINHQLYFEHVSQLLLPGGYYLLKIDSSKIKKFPDILSSYDLFFTLKEEWQTTYTRSDGKELNALFRIGINKEKVL